MYAESGWEIFQYNFKFLISTPKQTIYVVDYKKNWMFQKLIFEID